MSSLDRVRVTRYVTPLREGGSLPGIVEGEDLGTYVCKFRGAGQGLRVLVAEVIAGELARRIGLRTPRLVVLDLDPALARYEAAYLYHRVIRHELPNAAQQEAIRLMCTSRDLGSFLDYFQSLALEFNAFQLRQLGVYELCEKLITTSDLFAGQIEGPYLFRFMDAILEFGTRRSNHLADFLGYWETAKHKISITVPANADALRITTIHKSKGLEYPVVIIPNANWKFMPNASRDRIWVDLQQVEASEFVYERLDQEMVQIKRQLKSSVVSMVSALNDTPLQPSYEEEKVRTLLENLNLLYVAFTRPVQRLYVLAKAAKDWDKCKDSVNKWLYNYLNCDASPVQWEEARTRYVVYEGAGECFHNHRRGNETAYPMREVISNDRGDRLRLRRLAERIFDLETFEKKDDHRQKLRYALSLIQDSQDIGPVADQLCREGVLDQRQAKALREDLHTLLHQEDLCDLFQPGVEVKLNQEFLLPGGKSVVADRMVRFADGRDVILNLVAGLGNDDARRKLRRAMKAYESMGKALCKGALLALSDGTIEWLD